MKDLFGDVAEVWVAVPPPQLKTLAQTCSDMLSQVGLHTGETLLTWSLERMHII